METVVDFIFLGSIITVDGDCSDEIERHLLLGRKAMTNLDSRDIIKDIIKKHYYKAETLLCQKNVHLIKAMVFYVVMCECESWTIKKAEYWRTDAFELVLEKTLESPLGSKEVKSVHPKGNQPLIFIGRTDAEAEAPVLWPPDSKSWLIEKNADAGKDGRQKKKGVAEDEMVR